MKSLGIHEPEHTEAYDVRPVKLSFLETDIRVQNILAVDGFTNLQDHELLISFAKAAMSKSP